MNITLEKIELFFRDDLKIKQILHRMAPVVEDGYNQESVHQYMDKFLRGLKEIQYYLHEIVRAFSYEDKVLETIDSLFSIYQNKMIECDYGYDALKRCYQECCSLMDTSLLEKIKEEFVGYLVIQGDVASIILECKTINEVLHLIHSSIVNNENYYKNLNVISEKINDEGYPITIYGKENAAALQIFHEFPFEMSCGDADIISLSDKILMMMRDRGHALVIEIDFDEKDVWVNYFIPKICNVEMVNHLRGVSPVNQNSNGTRGSFRTSFEELSRDIIEFIGMVPMDTDMIIEKIPNVPVFNNENTSVVPEKKTRLQKLRDYLLGKKKEVSVKQR